jgi:hypothetical protein
MFRGKLSKALFCGMLAVASMTGAAMRPDEIEDLMHAMNRQEISLTVAGDPKRDGEPDDGCRSISSTAAAGVVALPSDE